MDVECFLALHTSAHGIIVKISLTPHPGAGLDSLTSGTIERGEMVGYYCGLLFYASPTKGPGKTRRYGEEVMQMTEERLGSGQMRYRRR